MTVNRPNAGRLERRTPHVPKEKKLENPATEKIKNMTKKRETIKEILDREKEKLARKEEQRKAILKKKEVAENIRKEKAKKWAMLRWINSFIEETQEKWEEMDLTRAMEELEENERKEENELVNVLEITEKKIQITSQLTRENTQKLMKTKKKLCLLLIIMKRKNN